MGHWFRSLKSAVGVVVVALTAFSFCATPAFAHQKPAKPPAEDPEIKLGRESHEEMLRNGLKLVKDPAMQTRIETIGKKLATFANAIVIPATYGSDNVVPYNYQFFIVDDKDVNAFCLPGGFIYINSGLLKYVQSDDELAGVIGHEIMHAAHHHVIKLQREQSRLNNQILLGLLAAILARVPAEATSNLLTSAQLLALQKVNGHSQNAERDADAGGIELVTRAHYNPVGALTFMERLARDEAASPQIEWGVYRTHPPSKERAQAMIANIRQRDMPINRRSVTNELKITTRGTMEGAKTVYELLLEGRVVYRSASKDEIDSAANLLNHALDNDLQIFDITHASGTVQIEGAPIFTVDSDNADAHGNSIDPRNRSDSSRQDAPCRTLSPHD